MRKFDSLLKTKNSKRKYDYNYDKIYKKNSINPLDYDYFESILVQELWIKNNKKYNKDLITLWGKLDMKSYIDYILGNTFNMYFVNDNKRIEVNKLDDYNYMHEDARRMKLLDIKYCKSLVLENTVFKDLYLVTFEILDMNNNFRPYVLLFVKNSNGKFIEIGYGYDSNNNGNVELTIKSFNYPVFLNTKGTILLPLSNKKVKLDVYDYITDTDIEKIEK